jgi:anti-sigma regulatory factor (Ser/Thr protein kinase)
MFDARSWQFATSSHARADRARHEFLALLRKHCGDDADYFSAELIFGELLANAVQHAPGTVDLSVRWNDGHACLTVRTYGRPCFPSRHKASLFDEHGRGLQIVSALSRDFRIENTNDGCFCESVLPVSAHHATA